MAAVPEYVCQRRGEGSYKQPGVMAQHQYCHYGRVEQDSRESAVIALLNVSAP